ncbi:MAG: hypothetical protein ACK4ZN_09550, partial [Oceanibaculum sp.]
PQGDLADAGRRLMGPPPARATPSASTVTVPYAGWTRNLVFIWIGVFVGLLGANWAILVSPVLVFPGGRGDLTLAFCRKVFTNFGGHYGECSGLSSSKALLTFA